MKYQADQTIAGTRKGSLRAKIKPLYVLGFVVWAAFLVLGIVAVLYEPEPEPRGSLSIGATDAPVTVMEFSDFQ